MAIPELKRGLTHGEKVEWDGIMRKVSRYQRKLAFLPQDQWDKMEEEIDKESTTMNKRLYEMLSACYGVEETAFDNMQNTDVEEMIDSLYNKSTTIPKNSQQPSQKPSSSEITTPQK